MTDQSLRVKFWSYVVGVHNEMSEKRDCVTRDAVVKSEYDGVCVVGHAAAEYLIAFG